MDELFLHDWIYGICIEITSRRESRIASRVKQMRTKNTGRCFVKLRSNRYAHEGLKNYDWFPNRFINAGDNFPFNLKYYHINWKLGFLNNSSFSYLVKSVIYFVTFNGRNYVSEYLEEYVINIMKLIWETVYFVAISGYQSFPPKISKNDSLLLLISP